MADHNARIIVSSDPAQLKATVDQLEKMGKVDKNNADKFKEHSQERHKLVNEGIDLNTKLTRSFAELGEGIIAAFAVERIIEFGKESVKAFAEVQEATSKLKFSIMSINGGTEESFNRLVEQAESASAKIKNLYTAKNIMGAQTQLSNFGISGKMIEELTPRILDIAAAKNITLAEATEKTILAMNGQTKGLRDIGVSFKDTGSKTDNFNKLLEQTTKLQGAAEEKSHTLAGRLEEMGNNWEVAKENVGSFLARGFDVIDFFANLTTNVDADGEALVKWQKIINASTEDAKKIRETLSSGGMAKTQYEIAKQQGADGLQLQKLLDNAKISIEKDFVEESAKLTDKQLTEELKKVEDSKEFMIKEYELHKTKKIEILKAEIATRKVIDNDDTEEGKAKKKAALDALLKIQEQYYKDLEAIRKKDADDNDKFSIELIKNETDKKLAAQDSAFRKEQEEFKTREDKLTEIMKNGKADQRIKAKIELDALFTDEELSQKSHDEKMLQIKKDAEKKIHDEEEAFNEKQRAGRLEWDKQQVEIETKQEEIGLKRKLINKQITQEEYDKKVKELQIKALEDKLKIEQDAGIQDVALQQEIEDKKLDLQKNSAKKTKELIIGIQEFTTTILESLSKSIESSIGVLDTQMNRQSQMIDYQKTLAEKGLANDLAFEERRQDELTKKKIDEQKKLKKVKEFETFLNALAKFSEENPNTALGKALGLLAATKGAEALFMEEGGRPIDAKRKTSIGLNGWSNRHKSGDLLTMLSPKEGVIPEDTMNRWGLTDGNKFSSFLRSPLKTMAIPEKNYNQSFNDNKIVSELQEVKKAIQEIPKDYVNWDALDQRIEERIERGIKTRTTHKKGI